MPGNTWGIFVDKGYVWSKSYRGFCATDDITFVYKQHPVEPVQLSYSMCDIWLSNYETYQHIYTVFYTTMCFKRTARYTGQTVIPRATDTYWPSHCRRRDEIPRWRRPITLLQSSILNLTSSHLSLGQLLAVGSQEWCRVNPSDRLIVMILTQDPVLFARGHDSDVIMSAMASQITIPAIVFSTAYSGGGQR